MENKLASSICNNLANRKIISYELKDIYIYGFELLLSFLISIAIIFIIGFILNEIISTIIFLTVFILIRRFTGGFHAPTYLKCKICTIGVYLAVLIFSQLFNTNFLMFLLLGTIGLCVICKWGPIENPNKPLTDYDKKKNRKIGTIFLEVLVILGWTINHVSIKCGNVIFYSLFSIIILMLYAIIKERRSKTNEKDS